MIRGGSVKTEKESPELLDPQSQDWFEQQLDNLSLRPDVRYLIYQIEHPNAGLPESERKEDGDSHYQFYIEFTKPIDMMKVVELLHRTTDLAPRRGPREQARHYCMKGNCGSDMCANKWESHGDKMCHEFLPEVQQTYREFGVWHSTGQRVDLDNLRNEVLKAQTWAEVILNPDIALEVARYGKFARELFDNRPKSKMELDLLPWQNKLVEELLDEPDDRKIIWYNDAIGNTGKSTLARYLVRNHDAIILAGSRKDALHGYDNQRIVIFDFSRTSEGKISYDAIEQIKNGTFFTTKYHSRMVSRPHNAHVVIFANWLPDLEALSHDRWDIRSPYD